MYDSSESIESLEFSIESIGSIEYYPPIGVSLNILGTICLIGICKVSKESSWQAGFNHMHNFRVSGTAGSENWCYKK